MTKVKNAPKKPTAVEKLQLSRYRPTQLELMGDDVDLTSLYLSLNQQGISGSSINIIDAIQDITVDRTIEGASTVTLTVADIDRSLLNSGRLFKHEDIQIDGLYFRLKTVSKNGSILTLGFEDREIAVARSYNKPIKASMKTARSKVTRAQFVLRMLREIKEFGKIPYVIPELNKIQPIGNAAQASQKAEQKQHDKSLGIPAGTDLTVKGQPISAEQRKNANLILDVGASHALPRPMLVMAIMCVEQESSIINLMAGSPGSGNYLGPDPRGNPVGCFQQIAKWGWPASRDVSRDALAFYNKLSPIYQSSKGQQYYTLIERVQNSGNGQAYAQWRTEAERIVNAYGVTDGSSAAMNAQWEQQTTSGSMGDYEFYRGIPPMSSTQKKKGKAGSWGKESTWEAWQRLANEVQWRAFFVSGTFYFISEDDLFKSQPIATLNEWSPGVMSIDGDYDENTKAATVTLNVMMGRWTSPPGSVIQLQNMGPWNGRWLVNDVSRSVFSREGTITLKKPLPSLPEPSGSNTSTTQGAGTNKWTWGGTPQPKPPASYPIDPGVLVQPVPAGYDTHIIQGVHPTAGLPGYPACDFGGNAGAPVLAVESGTITRFSGEDPALGPWDPTLGIHGPFGWNIYLHGDSGADYFYTHLGTRSCHVGQRVGEGNVIATIGNYAKYGGANHVHLGVHPPAKGHPDIQDIMNAQVAHN